MARTSRQTAMTAVLLAVVTTAGCGARRGRLVAWRPIDVKAAAESGEVAR